LTATAPIITARRSGPIDQSQTRRKAMRRHDLLSGFLAAFAAWAILAAPAGATDIRFTLDWAFQGPTAAFIAADQLGYYEEAGLEVTIDRGSGSAGAIQRVATGAYQMGFADINALVEFNAQNPGRTAKAVMMIYDAPPFGLYALKSSGIKEPADLVGKTLGAPVFDASFKLFPAFAAKTGIDGDAVQRVNMDSPLREAMLVRGEVDVISGHFFSSILDLETKGVPPDQVEVMLYKDYGMDFYGNAVIAADSFAQSEPEAVKAFNAAVAKATRWIIANRGEAVAMVAKVDPLIDQALERRRLDMAIETNIATPYVKANGMGGTDPERLRRAIAQIAEAVKLASPPPLGSIWSDAFLPPLEARRL
jgi:NitT/TauT family transport system substrate-binding protein